MAKKKAAIAFSVAALAAGVNFLAPHFVGGAYAYTMDGGYAVPEGETEQAKYNDLKQAIADGENVKLGSDITYYVQVSKKPSIEVNHSMTLDLNGHVLDTASTSGGSGGNTAIAVTGEGSVLTVLDSSNEKTGTIRYGHAGNTSPELIRVEAGAKLVLNSGTLVSPLGRANSREGFAVKVATDGAFEMNGGVIRSPEEAPSGYYGVFASGAGTIDLNAGSVTTNGTAAWIKTGAAVINIKSGVVLTGTTGKDLEISTTTATGTVTGVTLKDAVIAGAVSLNNVTITGDLDVKGGERTLSGVTVGGAMNITAGTTTVENVTVTGLTSVTGGTTTFGNGAVLNGGLAYQASYSANLTINEGAEINGFTQTGKSMNMSYTDKDTKEKVSTTVDSYGSLTINGGTFTGSFSVPTAEQIEQSNTARENFVNAYNEHSTASNPITYVPYAIAPEVSGGTFTVEPSADAITPGNEAELNDNGVYEIYPINVDYNNEFLEDGGAAAGHVSTTVEFNSELIADRKATLSAVDATAGGLTLNAEEGGTLILAADVNMLDRDGQTIGINGVDMTLVFDLTAEQGAALSQYDGGVAIVYFENGVEVERHTAQLLGETGHQWVEGAITHLSTYGVVGLGNSAAPTPAGTPDTGRFTMVTASATGASMVAAVMVGMIVSAATFRKLRHMRLYRRK